MFERVLWRWPTASGKRPCRGCNSCAELCAAVHGRLEFLKSAYLSIDRRVLAAFRITYGLVLLFELIRRGLHLKLLYSNDGIISNHFLLFKPRVDPQFSIYN